MAVKVKEQARLRSQVVISKREPYTLTHALHGLVPGSHVEAVKVTAFIPFPLASIEARVHKHLRMQMYDWQHRWVFHRTGAGAPVDTLRKAVISVHGGIVNVM